jgi:hypothetical protein
MTKQRMEKIAALPLEHWPSSIARTSIRLLGAILLLSTARVSAAQPPPGGGRGAADANGFVERMLSMDTSGDGRLSKAEVKDARLQGLFARIDANHDGVITKEEMTALYAKESATLGGGDGRGPRGPGGGFGPPGKRPGRGPRGFGPPGAPPPGPPPMP